MKVTDIAKWERTKDRAAYIGWLCCLIYFTRIYSQGASAPDISIPVIVLIFSITRLLKIMMKEG